MGLTQLPWHLEVGIIVMVIGPHDVRSLTLELKGCGEKAVGFVQQKSPELIGRFLGWLVC